MKKSKQGKAPPQNTGKKKPAQKKLKPSPKSLKRKTKSSKDIKNEKKTLVKKTAVKKINKPKIKKTVQTLKTAKSPKSAEKKTPLKKAGLIQKEAGGAKTSRSAVSYLYHLERELERIQEKEKKVSLKNSEGREYCAEENCDQSATTGDYCRLHYITVWHLIKAKNKILSQNKLKTWVGEIIESHRGSVLDYMVRDLSNEKDFYSALSEMKISSSEVKDDE